MRKNLHENVIYAIKTLNFVYITSFLDMLPLDPRCPLANRMSQNIYTTYVSGLLGLMRVTGTGLSNLKKTKYS